MHTDKSGARRPVAAGAGWWVVYHGQIQDPYEVSCHGYVLIDSSLIFCASGSVAAFARFRPFSAAWTVSSVSWAAQARSGWSRRHWRATAMCRGWEASSLGSTPAYSGRPAPASGHG